METFKWVCKKTEIIRSKHMYYVTARVNGIPPPGLAEAEPVSQCTAQSQAPPAAVSRCLRENPCTHFREDTHLLCPFACVLPGDFIKAERTQCIVNNFIHIFTFVWSCNCCAPSSTFRSLGNTSNLVKPTMLKKKKH